MAISLTLSSNAIVKPRTPRHGGLARRVSLGVAVVAIAIAAMAGEYLAGPPSPEASTGMRSEAAFTGEFADGLPVYRLAPITVVASRGTDPAK
jgi:hypothetical protein